LAIAAAAAAVAVWCWSGSDKGPAQIITLPNGDRYRFAGVTYGRKNTPPSLLARAVSWLPLRWEWQAQRVFGERAAWFNQNETYELPCLFVWFRRLGTNSPNAGGASLSAFVADETGVEGGVMDYPAFSAGIGWSYVKCFAVPRRSRMLQCNLYDFTAGGRPPPLVAQVSFRNPLYGQFGQWQPENVPTMKKAGDVEARLEHFATGVQESGTPPRLAHGKQGVDYRPGKNGEDRHTFFDVWLESKGGTTWVVQSAELSDATGNVIVSPPNVSSGGATASPMIFLGDYRLSLPGTLWADEAAWRLKLELKRSWGFDAADLVTFKNVPIPAIGMTNIMRLTNNAGGVKLVLTKFARNPTTNAWLSRLPETEVDVEVVGNPAGLAVDLWEMITDKGDRLEITGNGWWGSQRSVSLSSIPTNAQTVNITWAVQKMRSVEFMVKPPGAK
jgi:hypothetical protein